MCCSFSEGSNSAIALSASGGAVFAAEPFCHSCPFLQLRAHTGRGPGSVCLLSPPRLLPAEMSTLGLRSHWKKLPPPLSPFFIFLSLSASICLLSPVFPLCFLFHLFSRALTLLGKEYQLFLIGQGTPAVTIHKWNHRGESEVSSLKGSSQEVTCVSSTTGSLCGTLSASCLVCSVAVGG